jgi:hypothetical protein
MRIFTDINIFGAANRSPRLFLGFQKGAQIYASKLALASSVFG